MKVFNEVIPAGAGPCAKVVVRAWLTVQDGDVYEGTNYCLEPQVTCPRDIAGYSGGDGYHLCKDICKQPAHAEVNAINYANADSMYGAYHGKMEISHDWVCCGCVDFMHKHDIHRVKFNVV